VKLVAASCGHTPQVKMRTNRMEQILRRSMTAPQDVGLRDSSWQY
jgi:hypothetical protein